MARVLIPVNVLRSESVSLGLMRLLGNLSVLVLGYGEIPRQTDLDQARDNYSDRATAALEDIKEEFQYMGVKADHRLVFTHDRRKTIRRVADESKASAIAKTSPTGDAKQILVSLNGDVDTDRILTFLEALIGDQDIGVTLLAADRESEKASDRLGEAVTQLETVGIEVQTKAVTGPSFGALVDAFPDHDAIVIGEKSPSFRTLLYGDESERLASKFIGPVIVVRQGSY